MRALEPLPNTAVEEASSWGRPAKPPVRSRVGPALRIDTCRGRLIWLSPIFMSPMDDNGYDISDYQTIAPEFGTLDDFQELLEEAQRRKEGKTQ